MSFPRYPTYKPSGVEWLGEVPEHWEAIEARREIAFLTSGSRGWAEFYSDEGPIFLRIGNLTRDSIRLNLEDIQRVTPPAGVEGDRTEVHEGDVLFSITAYLGSVAVVPGGLERAYVSQHVCLARLANGNLMPDWLAYSVLSASGKAYLEAESYGGTKVQLALDDVKSFPLSLPPIEEQRSLITFLNRETAKIDALIAEQQRLIELLQEKRQAVISHAVTKGLNPHAPMKDSGVEWLGEVPEHWEVKPVKRLIRSIGQGWSPQCENYSVDGGEGWGVLKVGCVNGGAFRSTENKSLPVELDPKPELAIFKDDLLVSRANTRELVGSAAVALQDYPNLLLCDKLYRLRVDCKGAHPQFLSFFLGSREARSQIELEASGASDSMLNISQSAILELPCPAPPADEQVVIVETTNRQQSHLVNLADEAVKVIKLLQERRSALISAAVTGQIDVRGLVLEAEAA
ncbi:MAG: restriction endonuclease subunit S [Cyanobacteria bacterium]|nr:restriction endonuclease subunit S [Cyanobacteriota bacterium]